MRRSRLPFLPFADLPKQPAVPRTVGKSLISHSLPVQPCLLDWTPPRTHLPAEEVGLVLVPPEGFRPISSETYLYHLTNITTARACEQNGLSLLDRLCFHDASAMQRLLTDLTVEGDPMLLRVRQRFIRSWLTKECDGNWIWYVFGERSGNSD